MSNQVYANSFPINKIFADQRLNLIEASLAPGPGAMNKIAFFDASGVLNDAQITVSGTENSLTFDPGTLIRIDSITTSSGNLTLGGGLTNNINILAPTVYMTGIVDVQSTNVNIQAPIVDIGDIGATVQIEENLATTNILAQKIDNGTSNLDIGTTTTTTINLGRVGQIVICASNLQAQNIDYPGPVNLYGSSNFITLGQVAGTVQLQGSISFVSSGPAGIDSYYTDRQFGITGSGPFASTVILNWSCQRINSVVTISFMPTSPDILCTASSILTIDTALSPNFRPGTSFTTQCLVKVNGVYILGILSVSTLGVVTIQPTIGLFLITQMINISEISFAFDVLL